MFQGIVERIFTEITKRFQTTNSEIISEKLPNHFKGFSDSIVDWPENSQTNFQRICLYNFRKTAGEFFKAIAE